ncbi:MULTISPECIES: response regulator transcription factor [unclassified Clostridioides]|uniref:response regulator transcription factor n=1 Tax=unclassified Clostridioides TaxID=2635829 RepID=UPI001D127500|nr:response regulator transcription factor [Clostridioides sp. ZZV14-6154]MCC0720320.1 response regulator transcription factor [Clostridioides sp. ZZV14-6105]MCC0728844.1 response regulator transcription factor [Clostridioides sp. ZZV14-6045]MCC0732925.1 response regulator transcription factor [Clostridioides sp. ZZV14-6048]MCC0733394.1 response regulator transcription factor [Clostridioides sp. ZZV14-6009]MCC0737072.1 response regulator transcription factor [Clostridioides sp. ZZV14-5902]
MNQNILVVDDDKEIVDAIEFYLRPDNLNVLKAYDGLEALDILIENDIKLIIMDVMMPNLDGLKTTLKIREKKNIPIILLSAKSQDMDKIIGLNMGADDYITKPFNPLELTARVKSQLRRYINLGDFSNTNSSNDTNYVLKSGGLELNTDTKIVSLDGEEVKMTPLEYKILALLLSRKGKIFSSHEIYEKVWNEDAYSCERTVAVHIRRIREKIEVNSKEPKYLKVVWGIGYKIEKLNY